MSERTANNGMTWKREDAGNPKRKRGTDVSLTVIPRLRFGFGDRAPAASAVPLIAFAIVWMLFVDVTLAQESTPAVSDESPAQQTDDEAVDPLPAEKPDDADVPPKADNAARKDDGVDGPESNGEPAATVPTDHLVTWLHKLEKAKELSRKRRAPIIVVAGATWCGPCKVLEKEIAKVPVQDELQRWVPVHVDVDDAEKEAAELAVSSIPALRVLSPDGRLIASTEGAMDADALADWLAEQFPSAVDNAAGAATSGRLTAMSVLKILKDFKSRESTVREAAISRLVAVPEVAAAPVVTGFTDGGLSEQLAYLELLSTWEAPVKGLDPWIPTSVTAERIASLETWVTERDFEPPENSDELSAIEIIETRRILRTLIEVDATEAAALREQLARMGRKTLPLIRAALDDATEPQPRERLTSARYRVAGTAELESEWPGGTERLASANFDVRIGATAELVKLATKREEQLLLELFSDPVPLVREIALKGITKISGTSAGGALVRLLDDPDPNVRAAVLKQLAENPVESLIPKIAEYSQKETDPDLVVHAIRFLREIKKHEAVVAMSALFNHQSWRVRAEAADGIYRLVKKSGMDESRKDAELGQAFLKLLNDEDEFVVGVAIRTLRYVKATDAPDRLIEVAETRSSLAATAIQALGEAFMGRRGVNDKVLEFASDRDPAVRIAATVALLRNSGQQYSDIVKNGLWDQEQQVRIAVADAVFKKVIGEISSKLRQVTYASSGGSHAGRPDLENEIVSIPNVTPIGNGLFGGVVDLPEDEEDAPVPAESAESVNVKAGVAADSKAVERGKAIDSLLLAIRKDHTLSDWLYEFSGPLEEMLPAEDLEERLAAARTLILFGNDSSLEIINQAAAERNLFPHVVAVLPGLIWTEKETVFNSVASAAATRDERYQLADAMADTNDTRVVDKVWSLLAIPEADARLVAELRKPLTQSYYREYHYSFTDAETHEQNRLKADSAAMAESGSIWQKVMALSLLSMADRISMKQIAQELFNDDEQPVNVRANALQCLLGALTSDAAGATAMEVVAEGNTDLAQPALQYLALGKSAVRYLSSVIPVDGVSVSSSSTSRTTPIVPTAPEGLMLEQVEPFLDHSDPRTRASAAYLATLLGRPELTEVVVNYWKTNADDSSARRMAYRSIAVANDPRWVPQLKRMYGAMKSDSWDSSMSDFYWTIRIMTGPEILQFRKMIRGEQDADTLR